MGYNEQPLQNTFAKVLLTRYVASVNMLNANGHINRPVGKDRSVIKGQILHNGCKLSFCQFS